MSGEQDYKDSLRKHLEQVQQAVQALGEKWDSLSLSEVSEKFYKISNLSLQAGGDAYNLHQDSLYRRYAVRSPEIASAPAIC